MKVLNLKIIRCYECPYHTYVDDPLRAKCSKENEFIPDLRVNFNKWENGFPKFCKLGE